MKIAVLVSGGGTNLQVLIDRQMEYPLGKLTLVLASRKDAYALERAANAGIETVVVPQKTFPDRQSFTAAIVQELQKRHINLVVLAGFMYILSPEFVQAFQGRVLNVHPSLIPAFCGLGYYGLRVHKAALEYGVKVTGATVHIVTEGADEGPILLQKAIYINENETPESLQQRVMEECEWVLLPKAVKMMCEKLS